MPTPSPAVGGSPHSSALNVVLVNDHGLLLASRGETCLGFEALALLDGIVQFAEAIGQLARGGVGLEALGRPRGRC